MPGTTNSRGHTKVWESHHPTSRGHTEAWESISPTRRATQVCAFMSPYPQLKGPPKNSGFQFCGQNLALETV